MFFEDVKPVAKRDISVTVMPSYGSVRIVFCAVYRPPFHRIRLYRAS